MHQQLHLVLGGELTDIGGVEIDFRNPEKIHIVGLYTSHDAAVSAWRGNAQRTVDNALMRYFVVPLAPSFSALEHPEDHV